MDHSRKCQVCPMRQAKYQLDWMDEGSDVHLGHYYVRYTSPKKVTFRLWAQHVCCQCKHDGTLLSRMNFSTKPLNIDTFQKKESSNLCNMS